MDSIQMDSTKIRIPLREVSEVSDKIKGNWVLVNVDTGEQMDCEEWKRKAYFHESKGVKFRIALEKQPGRLGKVREYLTMMLTSKMLEGQYLEGIHLKNIKRLYKYIIDTGLASFSFDAFMNAECTDTDFKKDFENKAGVELVRLMLQRAKPKKTGMAAREWKKKLNKGIQWSERKSTAFKTNPYLKVYSKYCDLKSKSKKFAQAYDIEVSEEYWRIEATVKNRKHWRTFDIEDTSLKSILSLSKDIKKEILNRAMRVHLLPIRGHRKVSEGISPRDRLLYNLMLNAINLGQSYTIIEGEALQGLSPSNKSKKRKQLLSIYENHILPTEVGRKSENLDLALEGMGYDF